MPRRYLRIRETFPRLETINTPTSSSVAEELEDCDNPLFLFFRIYCTARQCSPLGRKFMECYINKASQAIQSPRTVPLFLLVSLLDGYSFPNVLVKGIVAFKH